MITFQKNSAAVIAFLKENHYSERTIRNYEKIYANAEAYLHNRESLRRGNTKRTNWNRSLLRQ